MCPPRTGSRTSVERLDIAMFRSSAEARGTPPAARITSAATIARANRFMPGPFNAVADSRASGELRVSSGLGRALAVEEYFEIFRLDAHESREQQIVQRRAELGNRVHRQERVGQLPAYVV